VNQRSGDVDIQSTAQRLHNALAAYASESQPQSQSSFRPPPMQPMPAVPPSRALVPSPSHSIVPSRPISVPSGSDARRIVSYSAHEVEYRPLSSSFDEIIMGSRPTSLELRPVQLGRRPRSSSSLDDLQRNISDLSLAVPTRPPSGEQVYVQTQSGTWVRAGNATLALVDGPTRVSQAFAQALQLETIGTAEGKRVMLKMRLLDQQINCPATIGDGGPDIQMGNELQAELQRQGLEVALRDSFRDSGALSQASFARDSIRDSGGSFTRDSGFTRESADFNRESFRDSGGVRDSDLAALRQPGNRTGISSQWPEFMRLSGEGRAWHELAEDDHELFAV